VILAGIFGLSVVAGIFLPVNENFILDIILRSALVTAIFGVLSYYLKVSQELNVIVNSTLKFLKSYGRN
jgi:hypothetical protein